MSPPLETLVLSGGALLGSGQPELIETRDPFVYPFSSSSLWNTSVGTGRTLGAPAWLNGVVGGTLVQGSLAWQFRTWTDPTDGVVKKTPGQVNFATYSTAINRGKVTDPPLVIRPVEGGTWGPRSTVLDANGNLPQDIVVPHAPENLILAGDMLPSITRVNYGGTGTNGGAISFTNIASNPNYSWQPDGFLSIVDEETGDVIEAYKGCWWPTAGGGVPNPASRIVIARRGVINRYSLFGDGWTTPSGRASRLGFVTGLIRAPEIVKAATDPRNAIRHALAIAMHASQMLRPSLDSGSHPAKTVAGYQWPARGRDGHAEDVYRGLIRMGMQFVLDPTWDFEADTTLSNEALALCYALRDYGCYVCDISAYGATLYAEQGSPTDATNRMKTAWQTKIMEHMVPVLNNSAAFVGGPGDRVRPPLPPLALAA